MSWGRPISSRLASTARFNPIPLFPRWCSMHIPSTYPGASRVVRPDTAHVARPSREAHVHESVGVSQLETERRGMGRIVAAEGVGVDALEGRHLIRQDLHWDDGQ